MGETTTCMLCTPVRDTELSLWSRKKKTVSQRYSDGEVGTVTEHVNVMIKVEAATSTGTNRRSSCGRLCRNDLDRGPHARSPVHGSLSASTRVCCNSALVRRSMGSRDLHNDPPSKFVSPARAARAAGGRGRRTRRHVPATPTRS